MMSIIKFTINLFVAFYLFIASFSMAIAHHGPGQFNSSIPVNITGIVTNVRFVNPHGYVYLDVLNYNGEMIPWRCELQAGSLLRRAGWAEDLFPIGVAITISGDQGMQEEHACALRTAVLADGRLIRRNEQIRELDRPTTPLARILNGSLNLSGPWAAPQRYPLGGAGEGRPQRRMRMGARPPRINLTVAGRQAIKDIDLAIDNPRFNCMATNIIFDWEFDRHVNEIIQTEDIITLKYGFMDIIRTIHLNNEHPVNIEPSRTGHSIGRWENNTLIIETKGFMEGYLITTGGNIVKHSSEMLITEWFSYDQATQGLTRNYRATDPLYFNGEFTGQDVVFPSNITFEEYACEELKDAAL